MSLPQPLTQSEYPLSEATPQTASNASTVTPTQEGSGLPTLGSPAAVPSTVTPNGVRSLDCQRYTAQNLSPPIKLGAGSTR
jgi:hypothetical protein